VEIVNNVLPWLYAVIGVCLIWLIIELILMVRRSRETINEAKKSLDSAVKDINRVTDELMPALKKVDPLMDRVSLSVDAINLEILKLDEIVNDVKTMTSAASSATESINTLTSAPVDFVAGVSEKIRRRFGPKTASSDSVKIGKLKANNDETAVDKLVDALDEAVSKKK
jgi:uncharacterized protein YoxC